MERKTSVLGQTVQSSKAHLFSPDTHKTNKNNLSQTAEQVNQAIINRNLTSKVGAGQKMN